MGTLPIKFRNEDMQRFLSKVGQLVVHIETAGPNSTLRQGSGNILTQMPTIHERSGRQYGVVHVKITSNMIQSTVEEQNCTLTVFHKGRRCAMLKPREILRCNEPEDLMITLVCETEDISLVDLIRETKNSLSMMARQLPEEMKESLTHQFCILVQSNGREIVLSVEKCKQADYGIKVVTNNGRPEANIMKIGQSCDALIAGQCIRKALLYTPALCPGSCGSPILKLRKTPEGFSLDIWTHFGLDRKLDLGISTFKVHTFKDLPIPLTTWPALPGDQMGHYSKVVTIKVAHPVMRSMEQRLLTLQNVPQLPYIANELAKGGFFFMGMDKRMTCYECGYTLRTATKRPSPFVLHCRDQPECQAAVQYIEHLLLCCVCRQRRISSLAYPCLHLKMCDVCSYNQRKCPACDTAITHRFTVYAISNIL
ncbi:unnamed protein product [Lymnaea stagnalis]|uniref:RING-type domain-containing protein n=1 Tax=Lymnaea stagnalis TaxID=6523 RepID=A0AAV2HZ99_LYMST